MIVGRIAADVATTVAGAAGFTEGIAIATGGAVAGCAATLCVASPVAVVAGAGVAAVGASVAVAGAVGIGENLALLSGNSGSTEPGFASEEKLSKHFHDHGSEFGYKSADEYLNGARKLTSGGDGIETFTRSNGDKLFYNSSTNEFGVVSKDGVIRTYFKPKNGIDYWLKQIGE